MFLPYTAVEAARELVDSALPGAPVTVAEKASRRGVRRSGALRYRLASGCRRVAGLVAALADRLDERSPRDEACAHGGAGA